MSLLLPSLLFRLLAHLLQTLEPFLLGLSRLLTHCHHGLLSSVSFLHLSLLRSRLLERVPKSVYLMSQVQVLYLQLLLQLIRLTCSLLKAFHLLLQPLQLCQHPRKLVARNTVAAVSVGRQQ